VLTDWRLWFVAPAILALGTVVLFPTVYLLWMSVTHWVVTDPESYFAGADNFQQLFAATDFCAARVTSWLSRAFQCLCDGAGPLVWHWGFPNSARQAC
jgi:ABC-type sugar transport system permease subunit